MIVNIKKVAENIYLDKENNYAYIRMEYDKNNPNNIKELIKIANKYHNKESKLRNILKIRFNNIMENNIDEIERLADKYNINDEYISKNPIQYLTIFKCKTCYIEDIAKEILKIYTEAGIVNDENYNDYYNFIKEIHNIKATSKRNISIGRSEFTFYVFFDVSNCDSEGDFKTNGKKELKVEEKCASGGLTKKDQLTFCQVCEIMNEHFISKNINANIKFVTCQNKKNKIAILTIDDTREFGLNGIDLLINGFRNLFITYKKDALESYISAIYKQYAFKKSDYDRKENTELSYKDIKRINIITNKIWDEIKNIIENNTLDMYEAHCVLCKIYICCFLLNSTFDILNVADDEKPAILSIVNHTVIEKSIDDLTLIKKLMDDFNLYKDKIRLKQHPSANPSSQSQVFLLKLEKYEVNSKSYKKMIKDGNKSTKVSIENWEKYINDGYEFFTDYEMRRKEERKKLKNK